MKKKIYVEEAIKSLEAEPINGWVKQYLIEVIESLAYERPEKPCDVCGGLEEGDTLYQYADWDGGIGFDYIRGIKFCPKCGRML